MNIDRQQPRGVHNAPSALDLEIAQAMRTGFSTNVINGASRETQEELASLTPFPILPTVQLGGIEAMVTQPLSQNPVEQSPIPVEMRAKGVIATLLLKPEKPADVSSECVQSILWSANACLNEQGDRIAHEAKSMLLHPLQLAVLEDAVLKHAPYLQVRNKKEGDVLVGTVVVGVRQGLENPLRETASRVASYLLSQTSESLSRKQKDDKFRMGIKVKYALRQSERLAQIATVKAEERIFSPVSLESALEAGEVRRKKRKEMIDKHFPHWHTTK